MAKVMKISVHKIIKIFDLDFKYADPSVTDITKHLRNRKKKKIDPKKIIPKVEHNFRMIS